MLVYMKIGGVVMLVNDEQGFYMNELFNNTQEINNILEDIQFNEFSDGENSKDNIICFELLGDLLKSENDILSNSVFDVSFMKKLKVNLKNGLSSCSDNDKRVAKRVIKLLRNKLFRTDNYLYIIDIYLVALKLIDDYVKTLNNEMLMRELIQIKYDLAMFKPELTNALLEKRFAFSDDIYICPEIYDYIYESNVFDDDYYKTIIKCYTKDLLKIKNDDYDDIEEQAKIYFYYSMIKSCSLFLKNSLTWEFFDEFIDKEQINLYSIGLLKSIIGSKDDLLKRVKFITLNR